MKINPALSEDAISSENNSNGLSYLHKVVELPRKCGINFKKYGLYLVRWQLSTPILAPVVAYFKHSSSVFGTREDWIGSTVANLIGGLIFFWVDRFIFTSKELEAQWEVQENITCVDCGKVTRGYRLVKTRNYDRTKHNPEFRCEECSAKKTEELRQKGVLV